MEKKFERAIIAMFLLWLIWSLFGCGGSKKTTTDSEVNTVKTVDSSHIIKTDAGIITRTDEEKSSLENYLREVWFAQRPTDTVHAFDSYHTFDTLRLQPIYMRESGTRETHEQKHEVDSSWRKSFDSLAGKMLEVLNAKQKVQIKEVRAGWAWWIWVLITSACWLFGGAAIKFGRARLGLK